MRFLDIALATGRLSRPYRSRHGSPPLGAALLFLTLAGCGGSSGPPAPATPEPAAVARVEIDLDSPETHGLLKRRVPAGQRVRLSLATQQDPSKYSMLVERSGIYNAAQGNTLTIETRTPLRPGELLDYNVARRDERSSAVVRIQVMADPGVAGWRWEDEETWLAATTAERLARLLYAAARGSSPPDDLSVTAHRRGNRSRNGFEVVVESGGDRLDAVVGEGGVWLPEAYDSLARQLLDAWGPVSPQRARPDAGLTLLLARSPAEGLDEAERQVSTKLDQRPASPEAHEEAALVLGCLGLREAAGAFTDTREPMSRMTAHLAAARALSSGSASPSGLLAGLTLDALAGRQSVVARRLDEARGSLTSRGDRAWARALRIRITGDWRLLTTPAKATPLEQLQHYRALIVGRGAGYGLDLLREVQTADLPDWGRIVLTEHPTVQAGNVFASALLEAELRRAADRLLDEDPPEGTPAALVSALRSAHEQGAADSEPGVIGRRLWAAYHERHIVAAIVALLQHVGVRLGMALEAEETYYALSQELKDVPLFPMIGFQFLPQRGEHPWRKWNAAESCAGAAALARERPERLTLSAWRPLRSGCPELLQSAELASSEGWFGEAYLPGTAYWPPGRYAVEVVGKLPLDDVEALHELAPWSFHLAQIYHIRIHATRPEALEEAYGPLLETSHLAMRAAAEAHKKDPDAYLESHGKLCGVVPDDCYEYANMLRYRGRYEDAARADERGIREGRDRLLMSNWVGWTVGYYEETGRRGRALEVAREAAAVGSYGGMVTLGALLDRRGRVDEASEVFHALAERYESGGHRLDRFFAAYQQRVGDGRFGVEAEAAFARVFPGGLERVDLDDFDEPAMSGVVFVESSVPLERAGLGEGAVVVALDGYRIHNVEQYLTVRRFRFERDFELIVYYKAAYRRVRASEPMRSLNAQFADYPRR